MNELTISNQIRQGFFGQEVQRLIKGEMKLKYGFDTPTRTEIQLKILKTQE